MGLGENYLICEYSCLHNVSTEDLSASMNIGMYTHIIHS